MRRLPAVDGLRGVAVAAVVVFHLGHAPSGFLGVDVFFVLSGYLITTLLVAEHQAKGTIQLVRFSQRRLLRLYPALLVMVAFVLAVAVVTGEAVRETAGDALASLLYVGNLVDLHGLLDHTWTLALEEQFYLVWPLLLLLALRHKRLSFGPALVLLAVLLAVDLAGVGWAHTYTRAMGLPVGCLLALSPRLLAWLARVGPVALVLLVLAFFLPLPSAITTGWPMSTAVPLAAATMAWVVAAPGGLMAWSPLVWLGLRSYSLYLWHFPLISLVLHHSPNAVPGWSRKALALVAALVMAELSYRLVETPVLRWRNRHVSTQAMATT